METLLIYVIVLLSIAVCALGGFWFYRAEQARKRSTKLPQPARSAAGSNPWAGAVRASRERI